MKKGDKFYIKLADRTVQCKVVSVTRTRETRYSPPKRKRITAYERNRRFRRGLEEIFTGGG